MVTDHYAHRARRRAIAPFFSKQNVASRQHVLRRNIKKLCQRIHKLTGSTFNLGAPVSAFTRDSASEFIVGRQYNELDLDDFGIGLSIASQGAGVFWRTTKHIRWFGPSIRAIPIDWAMKVADDGTKAFLRYLKVSSYQTQTSEKGCALKTPINSNMHCGTLKVAKHNLQGVFSFPSLCISTV